MTQNLYVENYEPEVKFAGQLITKKKIVAKGAVDFSAATSVTLPATGSGATTITSASANALAVGPNGTTTPALNVDGSVASAVTGISIQGKAAGAGVVLTTTSSAGQSNEDLYIDTKGAGNMHLNNNTGTGTVFIGSSGQTTGVTITSNSASAFRVGRSGNYIFAVDDSTSSAVVGIKITGAATTGTVAMAVTTDSGNANLSIDAVAAGTITIGGTSTGNVILGSTSNNVNLAQTEITSTNNATASFLTNGVAGAGGPTTAAQHGWAVLYVGGNKRWVPVWL